MIISDNIVKMREKLHDWKNCYDCNGLIDIVPVCIVTCVTIVTVITGVTMASILTDVYSVKLAKINTTAPPRC